MGHDDLGDGLAARRHAAVDHAGAAGRRLRGSRLPVDRFAQIAASRATGLEAASAFVVARTASQRDRMFV
jgi:hypothetical protein